MAALATVVATVAGCTSSGHHDLLTASGPAAKPYHGRLDGAGAARRALQCRYHPYAGGRGVYDDGLLEVQSTYLRAAEAFMTPNSGALTLPPDGYRLARHVRNRVLLAYEVRGRIKAAIILRNGITDYMQHTGWGVEAWAACDPAEYSAATIDKLGLGFWQDEHGRPAPIGQVESFPGTGWCDESGVGFLQTGRYPRELTYVRDTDNRLTRYLRAAYDGDTSLPSAAVDSGYHRDGRELWFGPDKIAVYLVSLTDKTDVERWPAVKPGVGCG
jgi:hypothetical protein